MSTTPIGWRPNLFPLTSHAAAAAAALKETVFSLSLSTHTQFEEAAGNKNGQKKKNKKDQKLVVSGSQTQRHFE
jgi:hypothetical protein